MTLKQRISRLEQRSRQEESAFNMSLAEMPEGLTPAEQQTFAERNSATATLRAPKENLRSIDGTSPRPPSDRDKQSSAGNARNISKR
jgi:hypothetical protein